MAHNHYGFLHQSHHLLFDFFGSRHVAGFGYANHDVFPKLPFYVMVFLHPYFQSALIKLIQQGY